MAKKTKEDIQQQAPTDGPIPTAEVATGNGNGKKIKCPVTREDFKAKAKPLAVTIDGQLKGALVREFNGKSGKPDGTGSFGWAINEKMDIMVDGVPCKAQVGLNIVLVGSKSEE